MKNLKHFKKTKNDYYVFVKEKEANQANKLDVH